MSILERDTKKRGILILDDSKTLQRNLRQFLSEVGYLNVHEAYNAGEAFARLHELREEVYLIVLDLRIPGEGGLAFFRTLANTHSYPVGVLVFTAFPEQEYRTEFFGAGTDDVMALDFFDKGTEYERFLHDISEQLERVYQRRLVYVEALFQDVRTSLDSLAPLTTLPDRMAAVEATLDRLLARTPGFLAQIGLDLVRAIVIAFGVIALLYLGLDDLLERLMDGLR